MRTRGRRWAAGLALGLVIVVAATAFFIEEPLRQLIESEMNRRLDGYTVRIGRLDLHPIGLSIDFRDLTVTQDRHPHPPVAQIAEIDASVQWRELLAGTLVADFGIETPVLHVNRAHFEKERADEVDVHERGWQDALRAMYPLEINELRVRDGAFTYVDRGPYDPLRLTAIDAVTTNIRNIRSRDRVYPSTVRAEAVVFDKGRVVVDGNADFLAEPHPGVLAEIAVEEIDLAYFAPLARRYHVAIDKGVVSAKGNVEYAPALKAVHVEDATIRAARLAYTYTGGGGPAPERRAARRAARTAARTANDPGVQLIVDHLRIEDSTFAFVNRAAAPDYRVFVSDTDVELSNLSNQLTRGTAKVTLTAQFMGTGDTTLTGTFRPEIDGPDFDLNVKIRDTEMRAMNDLLRAHGKFDVVRGLFSFYSELRVKSDTVRGYVKPLFRDVDAFDRRQDREKNVARKLYEGLVGGLAALLENTPRDEVATKAEITGRVADPKASTWEVVVNLVQNAFFDAILPGFEREARKG